MKTLRAAVVGTGHLGRHHARNLARVPGVELIAVVDPDEERGRAAAQLAGTRWVAAAAELPAELDLVSIAAPTPLHFELARGYLERRVHCLIEKPMCATLAEARALARLADECGVLVQIGHIERFNPVLDALPADLEPRFMDLRRLAPYPNRSVDTSVVFDLMIHDLDLALWFARSPVVDVQAVGGAPKGPLEDYAACRLRFASGAVAHLMSSRVAGAAVRRAVLQEAARTIEIDFGSRHLTTIATDQQVVVAEGGAEEPLYRELAAFVRCIRDAAAPLVSQREGLAAVELAERVIAAMRT